MLLIIIPHIVFYLLSKNKEIIDVDTERMSMGEGIKGCKLYKCTYLLIFCQEFRNIFYYRIGKLSIFLRYLPRLSSLYIRVPYNKIGKGLLIQHGFSTIINAESIGDYCWINQQVTIGYSDSKTKGLGRPVIGNNVRIGAGAKVIGPITIGDNSTIGANAVASKNVPPNTTIVPSSMRIIQQNGYKCNKQL